MEWLLTLNGIQCTLLVLRIQVSDSLAHHQTQFDLIVQADTLGAENGAAVREKDGGGGLQEEEGLLGGGIVQLGNVIASRPSAGITRSEGNQRHEGMSQAN